MAGEHGQVVLPPRPRRGKFRPDAIQPHLSIKLRHRTINLAPGAAQSRTTSPGADPAQGVGHGTSPAIVTPFEPDPSEATITSRDQSRDRDAMAEQLKIKGIHTGFHYPVPVHFQALACPVPSSAACCDRTRRRSHPLPMPPAYEDQQAESGGRHPRLGVETGLIAAHFVNLHHQP